MDTKINNYSLDLMSKAINTLKDVKTQKAERAFYSVLDSAVKGNLADKPVQKQQSTLTEEQTASQEPESSVAEIETDEAMPQVKQPQTGQAKAKPDAKNAVGDAVEEEPVSVLVQISSELDMTVEELVAQLQQLVTAVTDIITDNLNITEQELNTVLNELGLSVTDLFQQPELMQVVVAVTGAEGLPEILTNEELYGQIQELVEQLDTVKQELPLAEALPPEQLKLLEETVQPITVKAETDIPEDSVKMPAVSNQDAPEINTQEQSLKEPVLEVVKENGADTKKSMDHMNQQMTGGQAFQQFAGRVAEFVQQTPAGEFSQQAQIESVIRQITDYVKLQVQAETTSLEMQLYPESYGKLNLHVAVRDGVVTARMAVENEAVKSALEAQVVQLREDMNERGLKVDAVEVTIASHEFERNLEERQGNQQSSQEESSSRRRQINLQNDSVTVEELAAMSEAESLTRKIMMENGNSIDFSA